MTSEELKAAIRAFIYDKDAYTSNGASNVVHAMDLIIDELAGAGGSGGGSTPGLDDVLAQDQDITVNREIKIGLNVLEVETASGYALRLSDPASVLNSTNLTGGGNLVYIQATTSAGDAEFRMQAEFNDGAKEVRITGRAADNISGIEYNADRHIFNGVQEFADNAAALSGGLIAGTHYIRTAHGLDIVV